MSDKQQKSVCHHSLENEKALCSLSEIEKKHSAFLLVLMCHQPIIGLPSDIRSALLWSAILRLLTEKICIHPSSYLRRPPERQTACHAVFPPSLPFDNRTKDVHTIKSCFLQIGNSCIPLFGERSGIKPRNHHIIVSRFFS